MKAPQKLDFNYTKYGQMSLEWMQIWCIRSILVKFSQIDLYCIQITKHTSNV
jgi:hypothetical protein